MTGHGPAPDVEMTGDSDRLGCSWPLCIAGAAEPDSWWDRRRDEDLGWLLAAPSAGESTKSNSGTSRWERKEQELQTAASLAL